MSESTAGPAPGAEDKSAPVTATEKAATAEAQTEGPLQLDIRTLLEAGVHFGHQTHRWNPRMREFIFGERAGIHILDLDQTLPRLEVALEFLRETTANGGRVLFVGTKKQAAPIVQSEAARCGQFYVNRRWLGGMLTNWRTVKKSIETYKKLLELFDDEERKSEMSKKELARLGRQAEKYAKSLEGMKEMSRLPDALFVVDVGREDIAVAEAKRLGIPIVAVVDSNCNPENVDFVVPGNDDSIRAISLYCKAAASACLEGAALHQERLQSQPREETAAEGAEKPAVGRRVVEIKQPPRRGRGQAAGGAGAGGRARSAGGTREDEAASKPAETPGEGSQENPPASS